MAVFDFAKSVERARRRFGEVSSPPTRAPRSDRGGIRLRSEVVECVADALSGQERLPVGELLRRISACCREAGHRPPSRATVYKLMAKLPLPTRRVGDLPASVQAALYNLTATSDVPEHQIAFHCFNHGDLRAMSYAAGLPWLAIWRALRLRGWRRKSRGPAEAVARVRGI